MAIDTKNKQGSAMLLTMPWRPWLAEPDGSLDGSDQLSLLKLYAGTAAPPAVPEGLSCVHMVITQQETVELVIERHQTVELFVSRC
jgi:hypothetical protein